MLLQSWSATRCNPARCAEPCRVRRPRRGSEREGWPRRAGEIFSDRALGRRVGAGVVRATMGIRTCSAEVGSGSHFCPGRPRRLLGGVRGAARALVNRSSRYPMQVRSTEPLRGDAAKSPHPSPWLSEAMHCCRLPTLVLPPSLPNFRF